MKRMQTGFTMIELIVVIVILGVLAAAALPKFVNIQEDAEEAALAGVAGSMASAMSVNYGGCLVTNHAVDAQKCRLVNTCDDVAGLLQGDVLPTDYAVGLKTGETASTTNGTTYICEVWHTDRTTIKKEYQAISAGNP